MSLVHRFVDFIPKALEPGVIYVALDFGTVAHLCGCGCGREVVTPLGPEEWKLIYDGESITLTPSIGNWSYPCSSHYFIRNNHVVWAQDQLFRSDDFGGQEKPKKGRRKKKSKKAPLDPILRKATRRERLRKVGENILRWFHLG